MSKQKTIPKQNQGINIIIKCIKHKGRHQFTREPNHFIHQTTDIRCGQDSDVEVEEFDSLNHHCVREVVVVVIIITIIKDEPKEKKGRQGWVKRGSMPSFQIIQEEWFKTP